MLFFSKVRCSQNCPLHGTRRGDRPRSGPYGACHADHGIRSGLLRAPHCPALHSGTGDSA